MNLRDIIKHVIQSRAEHPAQQGGFQDAPYRPGAPETGAGVYGRAGGAAPGMPMKPIAGLHSGMGGPVMQRNYGNETSDLPVAAPSPPPIAQAAGPSLPPAALSNSLRAGAPQLSDSPPPAGAEVVPFNPPGMEGTPLPPQDPALSVQHMGGQEDLAPAEYMGDDEDNSDINIKLDPITIGGDDEDAELERAAQQLQQRIMERMRRR